MADKFRTHHIILVNSSRRGIISVAIGGSGSRGTYEVTILIVIIVGIRISTTVVVVVVVVAVGIIIDVIFGFFVIGINDGVIFGFAFGCSIKIMFASGKGTVIIRSRVKKMLIVAFEIIIDVVFGRIVIVVVVVNCEDSTLSGRTPAVGIIIVGDEAKGPIIVGNRVLDTAVDTSFV